MGTHRPQTGPWPLTMAVEWGSNRGLAVGERRRVLLGEELSGQGRGGHGRLPGAGGSGAVHTTPGSTG